MVKAISPRARVKSRPIQQTIAQKPAGSVERKASISLNTSSIGFAYAADVLQIYAVKTEKKN